MVKAHEDPILMTLHKKTSHVSRVRVDFLLETIHWRLIEIFGIEFVTP